MYLIALCRIQPLDSVAYSDQIRDFLQKIDSSHFPHQAHILDNICTSILENLL